MKTKIKLMAMLPLAIVLLSGCSTTNEDNSYYGYSNSKHIEEAKKADARNKDLSYAKSNKGDANASDAGWVNPLASGKQTNNSASDANVDDSNVPNNDDQSFRNMSYRSTQIMYVPVIVPWWSRYYGWSSYCEPGFSISYNYGPYWSYDWYSPWYDYHPYYGSHWANDYYYPYHHWYHQPVYGHHSEPVDTRTRRTFGSSRGAYSYSSGRETGISPSRNNGINKNGTRTANRTDANGTFGTPSYRNTPPASQGRSSERVQPQGRSTQERTPNRTPAGNSNNGNRGQTSPGRRTSDNNVNTESTNTRSSREPANTGSNSRNAVERSPSRSNATVIERSSGLSSRQSSEKSSGSSNRTSTEKSSSSTKSDRNSGTNRTR